MILERNLHTLYFIFYSGDRLFPPQTGLSYSTWICVERFCDPRVDPHAVRLLTLVRSLHPAKEQHLICLSICLSARDKAIIVTTQETPLAHSKDLLSPILSIVCLLFFMQIIIMRYGCELKYRYLKEFCLWRLFENEPLDQTGFRVWHSLHSIMTSSGIRHHFVSKHSLCLKPLYKYACFSTDQSPDMIKIFSPHHVESQTLETYTYDSYQ